MISRRSFLGAAGGLLLAPPARAGDGALPVASTTSIKDSGLGEHLRLAYREASGVELEFLSNPSELAASVAANGRASALIVNHPRVAANLGTAGVAISVQPFMQNDFVLAGPRSDPAGAAGAPDAPRALERIARARAPFVSRGDGSGTHDAEMRLWAVAGVYPVGRPGYLEANMGMGRVIQLAVAQNAYVLADRATWLATPDHGACDILLDRDPLLANVYFVLLVKGANAAAPVDPRARDFVAWLTGDAGQRAIAEFRVGGEPGFEPLPSTR